MEKPKVSIVIPVYNTEAYVEDTILSIVNQSLRDSEIIVINDGSTDNSLPVIEKLAEKDPRIRIYSQENQGLSAARNAGIEHANGKYLYFMDSDDLLDPDALEQCVKKCEANNLDFLFFDAETFSDDKQFDCSVYDYFRARYVEDRTYSGEEILDMLIDKKIYKASACLSLIRLDYLNQIGLRFYPGIIHEDELFSGLLYIQAKRVGCIPRPYFKRRARSGSITTRVYSYKNIDSYLQVSGQLKTFLDHRTSGTTKKLMAKLIFFILDPSIYNARVLPLNERITVLGVCMLKSFFRFISLKSLIVLLFPVVLTIKSFLKK